MRLTRLIAAVALVAAVAPARAFHREEVQGTPGRCLWWRTPSVTYRLNAANANPKLVHTGCPLKAAPPQVAKLACASATASAGLAQPNVVAFAAFRR